MIVFEAPGITVDDAIVDDPLLGPAHVVTSTRTTTMSAIDWRRPTEIPTIAAPAALAPGAGGALMNAIATRARDAGVSALRYRGRYPTAALFATLLRSFRTHATETDFTSHFRLAGPPTEIPIDFAPAPFERISHACGYVEVRDGVEGAVVTDLRFDRGGSIARLVDDRGCRAEVWFGDARYAHVATFDGPQLVDGPHAIPPITSAVLGKPFPPPLVAALAELVADLVPAPLADDARRDLPTRSIVWADLGARAAVHDRACCGAQHDNTFAVHAVLWERLSPRGMARLAEALAEALAPVVTRALVAQLSRDVDLMSQSP